MYAMDRQTNNRGHMDPKGAKCMQINAVLIEDNVEAKHITTFLYSKFILTHEDKTEIDDKKTRRDRICLLIDRLMSHGGVDAFPTFLQALRHAQYKDISATLRDTMRKIEHQPDSAFSIAAPLSKVDDKVTRLEARVKKMEMAMEKQTKRTTKETEELKRQIKHKDKKIRSAEEEMNRMKATFKKETESLRIRMSQLEAKVESPEENDRKKKND